MSSTELALFSVAKEALAEAVKVDEVKDVRDHAERIRLYGQQAKDRSIIADATEIIMRAERRLGELLRSAHETGQLGIGRPSRSNVADEGEEAPEEEEAETVEVVRPQRVTLAEAGISKKLSTRSQKYAAVAEPAFEAAVLSTREKILAGGAVVVNPLKDLSTAEKKSRRAAREIELGAKQMALPEAKFGVILTDDEWDYETWSANGMDRSAANHYPTSSLDELKKRDVLSLAADDATLWLWTTAPHLAQGIELMAHRGFEYKTCVIWEKEYPGEAHGMGRWFWINHEILLLGTRGNVPAPAPGTQWPSIIKAPVGEHSAKPDVFYELIEAYFPSLPKVELNARRARQGWVRWGYEAPEENSGQVAASGPVASCADHDDGNGFRLKGDATLAQPGVGTRESDALAEASGTSQREDSASPDLPNPPLPLTLDQIDDMLRAGDVAKTSLADLVISTGLSLDQVKKRRKKLGIANRDRQREAVAEANRRRAQQGEGF